MRVSSETASRSHGASMIFGESWIGAAFYQAARSHRTTQCPIAGHPPTDRSLRLGAPSMTRNCKLGEFLLVLSFAVTGIGSAAAQNYPSRPITLVIPAPPGGPGDTLARLIAEPMRASLGQPIVIENIGGANGTIGTAHVVRAAPDGRSEERRAGKECRSRWA